MLTITGAAVGTGLPLLPTKLYDCRQHLPGQAKLA
jgi:hypothetical protein